jgi:hypothetical protein
VPWSVICLSPTRRQDEFLASQNPDGSIVFGGAERRAGISPTSPTGGGGRDEGFEIARGRVQRSALQEMIDQAAWRGIGAVIFGGGWAGRSIFRRCSKSR